jgi:hypothetical protein
MAGDENDRYVRPVTSDLLLEIEATKAREHYVENQATRAQRTSVRKKLLRGSKNRRLPTGLIDQPLEAFAHRNVVINNVYDRGQVRHGQYSRHKQRKSKTLPFGTVCTSLLRLSTTAEGEILTFVAIIYVSPSPY